MSYRNIDSDERLLIMARRYWDEEDQLNETQYRWVLKNEGYSEREIDNAISDYWDIHLRSNILLHYWIAPILLTLLIGPSRPALFSLVFVSQSLVSE